MGPRIAYALALALLLAIPGGLACATTPEAPLPCPELYRDHLARPALRITRDFPPVELVDHKTFPKWRFEEWKARTHQPMTFEFTAFDTLETVRPPAQEVLLPEDFAQDQKRLIARLRRLQTSPKYNRDYAKRQFVQDLEKYTQVLANAKKRGIATELTALDAQRYSAEDLAANLKSGVEVGAFRITLKNGKALSSVFTSSERRFLAANDIHRALFNLFKPELDLRWGDVATLEFFHTHPEEFASPLSESDIRNAETFKTIFRDNGAAIESHVYAISVAEGQPIIFHYGTH